MADYIEKVRVLEIGGEFVVADKNMPIREAVAAYERISGFPATDYRLVSFSREVAGERIYNRLRRRGFKLEELPFVLEISQ